MMKLGRDEFKRSEEQPVLALFAQGIKSPMTLEKYTRTLRLILCKVFEEILDGAFEERAEQLVRLAREDPEWARDLLLNLSRKLRERTKLPPDHPDYFNPVSFSGYFKPIKKLFEMNGVLPDWKRVYATTPEEDNPTDLESAGALLMEQTCPTASRISISTCFGYFGSGLPRFMGAMPAAPIADSMECALGPTASVAFSVHAPCMRFTYRDGNLTEP